MKWMMKLLIISVSLNANAQAAGNMKQTAVPLSKKQIQEKRADAAAKQRGSGQYHGSRDTTPGSPMGTGGAGGDMSGSPAASAIETDDQTSKAKVAKATPAAQAKGPNSMRKTKKKASHLKRTKSAN